MLLQEECKVIFTRSQRRENAKREKRAEGVLEDVSNEERKNNKREKGDEEKEESFPCHALCKQGFE